MDQIAPYVLWLPSWYPNQLQPYNGDFVQRHAVAASLFNRIEMIHVVKDEKGVMTTSVETVIKEQDGLRETIVYYYSPSKFPSFISRLMSHRRYQQLYKQAIRGVVAEYGKPVLIQVYIALKAGIIGRWASKAYKIPYVVAEQSTIYLDEATPNLRDEPAIFQKAAQYIFNGAASVMAVSEYLKDALKKKFQAAHTVVIPNVVNEKLFRVSGFPSGEVKKFVHVSNLNYQKNPEAIIKAFKIVEQSGFDFQLDVVGPDVTSVKDLVKQLRLDGSITFYHEMPQEHLAMLVSGADALILFSRYETFGCVIIEALASGVPVILSDIPVHHENADQSNALFAASESAEDLAEKIKAFIRGDRKANKNAISKAAIDRYNYPRVGKLFDDWYRDVVKKKKGS